MGICKEFLVSEIWTIKPKEHSQKPRGDVPNFSINSFPATVVQDKVTWFWQFCWKGTVLEEIL